ncbi:MAG: Dam family site-specific DNA-(adenine-N6)-methyltransferase [Clostridiales bacterium]|nr:Dam family site-specific DNA-(adenine-N6)-methyltransferase [Clostridiales bacterium]
MRYIGSKATMLENIESVIKDNTTGNEKVFCDIFAGTGAVSRHFKPQYEVHSNDSLYFSYVIQKATIENNRKPMFKKLAQYGINDPFKFLEDGDINLNNMNYFITNNYAPNENCNRMYVSTDNATRIDFIRNTIEQWKSKQLIDEMEYYYLLAGLIEGVPFVSNITGTYGAYLKEWDKRALKDFEMLRLDVIDNKKNNKSYNMDANALIRELEGDILYLDPPYNSRQYAPNYHFLETISKYDNPTIHGITGMREYSEQKSDFCIKNKVLNAFEDLIDKAKFSNIVMSYSTDGLMSIPQIENIFKKYGIERSYKMYSIPYRKYKSKVQSPKKSVNELLFYVKKDIPHKSYYCFENINTYNNKIKPTSNTKKYLKSPLNYIGGKYKLLPQIMPLFPQKINTFVDLFSGGSNVAINVSAKNIICNDINSKIIELFKCFQEKEIEEILSTIEQNIKKYSLSKENEYGFKTFRDYYNKTKDPLDLYTLTCYSFNYQFRFNNNLEYNNPFGRNRSQFSDTMKQNLIAFVNKLKYKNIIFTNTDFNDFNVEELTVGDMIYCDPPYLITTGTYNDGNRGFKDWKEPEEHQLYQLLNRADDLGINFALSNVMEHKGRKNEILEEWSKRYNLIDLNYNYSNSSYNTSKGGSREVLITNY